jgi:hypothetical protein
MRIHVGYFCAHSGPLHFYLLFSLLGTVRRGARAARRFARREEARSADADQAASGHCLHHVRGNLALLQDFIRNPLRQCVGRIDYEGEVMADVVSREEFEDLRKEIAELKLSRMQKIIRAAKRDKRLVKIVIAGILVVPVILYAANITKPHDFVAGNPTIASEVNANFDTLYTKVNEIDNTLTAMNNRLAKAWVKYNGTLCSPNCTILASNNIASVVRNATGDFTVTFATAMTDANYVTLISATGVFNGTIIFLEGTADHGPTPNTTTSFRFGTWGHDLNAANPVAVHVAVFGN